MKKREYINQKIGIKFLKKICKKKNYELKKNKKYINVYFLHFMKI